MFHLFQHPTNMRFFQGNSRNNFENINPRDFPPIFAVCRGVDPHPQFQIISIERVRGYDEYASYAFVNESFENTEWRIVYDGNPEDIQMGQMFVDTDESRRERIRFEIRNIFLVSRDDIYPVVMVDNFQALPRVNAVIVPQNSHAIHNPNYNHMDPHFTMNYLMDRNNFFFESFPNGNRNLSRAYRNRVMSPNHNWFDDDHRQIRTPPPIRRFNDQEDMDDYYRHSHSLAHGGAGAASSSSSSRRTRRPSNPRIPAPAPAPPPAAAQAPARPITLQAFTIQALINHAVEENTTCPISMNPILKASACVLSCQHVFERDAITRWFSDHDACPVCRQNATICN